MGRIKGNINITIPPNLDCEVMLMVKANEAEVSADPIKFRSNGRNQSLSFLIDDPEIPEPKPRWIRRVFYRKPKTYESEGAGMTIPSDWKISNVQLIGAGYITRANIRIYAIRRGYAAASFQFELDPGSKEAGKELTFNYIGAEGQETAVARSTRKPRVFGSRRWYEWKSHLGGSEYAPYLEDGQNYMVWLTDSEGNKSQTCAFKVIKV